MVIAWRIISTRIYIDYDSPAVNSQRFYTDPVTFSEKIRKYFTEFHDKYGEDGVVLGLYPENKLSNFSPTDVTRNFSCPGIHNLFTFRFDDWNEPRYRIEIETVEVE